MELSSHTTGFRCVWRAVFALTIMHLIVASRSKPLTWRVSVLTLTGTSTQMWYRVQKEINKLPDRTVDNKDHDLIPAVIKNCKVSVVLPVKGVHKDTVNNWRSQVSPKPPPPKPLSETSCNARMGSRNTRFRFKFLSASR